MRWQLGDLPVREDITQRCYDLNTTITTTTIIIVIIIIIIITEAQWAYRDEIKKHVI